MQRQLNFTIDTFIRFERGGVKPTILKFDKTKKKKREEGSIVGLNEVFLYAIVS